MPKYYEEKEEDGQACGGVREDLRQCLLESPCVLQSVSKMESMLVEIEFSLELDSRGMYLEIQALLVVSNVPNWRGVIIKGTSFLNLLGLSL
ncbi:hypothetical protein ASZ78_000242 [Callipepla squamata]|uniref:Uncharacterized protein n=1 Tax=Callipepla squamata TaxID=9009 RepID=A0A226MQV1_CALSU|nr:hypothetical protein ASZ78_000242 [Callipepla squamata]